MTATDFKQLLSDWDVTLSMSCEIGLYAYFKRYL